jgi:TonB family protein
VTAFSLDDQLLISTRLDAPYETSCDGSGSNDLLVDIERLPEFDVELTLVDISTSNAEVLDTLELEGPHQVVDAAGGRLLVTELTFVDAEVGSKVCLGETAGDALTAGNAVVLDGTPTAVALGSSWASITTETDSGNDACQVFEVEDTTLTPAGSLALSGRTGRVTVISDTLMVAEPDYGDDAGPSVLIDLSSGSPVSSSLRRMQVEAISDSGRFVGIERTNSGFARLGLWDSTDLSQPVASAETDWVHTQGRFRVDVLSVRIVESSGNVAFDRSVEQAVRSASPLPRPSDPALYDREIEFTFEPA